MKKIIGLSFLIMLIISAFTIISKKSTNSTVEVKDGWYYINGKKFFIKGLGYEIGASPGQDPYQQQINDFERMRFDLKVIKDAGFNTIRTWSQLTEGQLKIVQESGLKIIFGIWINPEKNYGDAIFIKESEDLVKTVVAYTKKYDCVITYLI